MYPLNKHYLVQSFVECNPSVAASGFQIQQVSPLKLFQTFRKRLAPSVYRSHANLKDRQSHISNRTEHETEILLFESQRS